MFQFFEGLTFLSVNFLMPRGFLSYITQSHKRDIKSLKKELKVKVFRLKIGRFAINQYKQQVRLPLART